jgi:hypothetical protein
MRGRGSSFGNLQGLVIFGAVLSPYTVNGVSAAQVCTTNADGQTVCHDKLSGGVIAAIVITIVLGIVLCAGIYYIIRRTRVHQTNSTHTLHWAFGGIPPLHFSSRSGRRDEEEGDSDDDEKYLSVEKNQIQGPTWEARYDPSSAPLPVRSGSGWSSRLRGLKSGARSGSDYGGFGQPMSAPGHSYGQSKHNNGSRGSQKPRSAGAAPSTNYSPLSKNKVHWGSLIHGNSKSGSKSAGPSLVGPVVQPAVVRTRQSPGLHIIAAGPGGFYNAPVIPPITPHTPRTPSRLGTAPPVSAGPGFSSAPIPRTPRTPGTPLTPRPLPTYSPVMPRGHMGAI